MDGSRSLVRPASLRLLLALSLLLAYPAFSSTGNSAAASSGTGTPGPMTLEAWREISKKAEEAVGAPEISERIARCEAFIRDHPDYPEISRVLSTLARAYLEKGDFDPDRVAGLFEESVRRQDARYSQGPIAIVEGSYVPHKLPIESARRLLRVCQERISGERRDLELETDPRVRRQREAVLDRSEARIPGVEGEVLLAHGNVAGALARLQESRDRLFLAGRGLVAISPAGETVGRFPTAADIIDQRLDVALARALAMSGRTAEGRSILDRILDCDEDSREFLQPARAELGMAPRGGPEVHGDLLAAPTFTLKDLQGKAVRLQDLRSRIVLLTFWATT